MLDLIKTTLDVGLVANKVASDYVFVDYLQRKSVNTKKAQNVDLGVFSTYLAEVNIRMTSNDLQTNPQAWTTITWGLVAGFVKWGLVAGYATSTLNRALSTIKVYSELAYQSNYLPLDEHLRIKNITSFSHKETKRIDENRGLVRRSNKKESATHITEEQAQALKSQPDTPQGRRDAVIMCLLLDHGLRCGELADLSPADFDMKAGVMRFYRSKTDVEQSHKLSADALRVLQSWFASDCASDSPYLLRGSRKGGELTNSGMNEISLTQRVGKLGGLIGLDNLSAHDCRHYWATKWAGRVDVFRLQEAGGWKSLAMPRRYVERAKIANEGMV
jgi:integrase